MPSRSRIRPSMAVTKTLAIADAIGVDSMLPSRRRHPPLGYCDGAGPPPLSPALGGVFLARSGSCRPRNVGGQPCIAANLSRRRRCATAYRAGRAPHSHWGMSRPLAPLSPGSGVFLFCVGSVACGCRFRPYASLCHLLATVEKGIVASKPQEFTPSRLQSDWSLAVSR
jgi:hypothetical protein